MDTIKLCMNKNPFTSFFLNIIHLFLFLALFHWLGPPGQPCIEVAGIENACPWLVSDDKGTQSAFPGGARR